MRIINTSPPTRGTWQALLLGALLAVSAGGAQAIGTLAGTDVHNIARLTYSVGGVGQIPICSSATGGSPDATPGTENCDDNPGDRIRFRVDNRVDVLVDEVNGNATDVVPGATGVYVEFTVTNQGNQTQDIALQVINLASGSHAVPDVSGGPFTDNFDATGCTVSMHSTTGSATFNASGPHINALAPDEIATIRVTCSIPPGLANDSRAVIALRATAHANDGAPTLGSALTQSSNNDPLVEDIVFGDGAGTDDPARDARHSDRDMFRVVTATLSVTKTVQTICDPLNGNSSPFNIPGAVVRWTITIANTGSASATLTQIADALSAHTTFDPDLITGGGGAGACEFAAGGAGTPESGVGRGVRIHTGGSPARPMSGTPGGTTTSSFFTGASDGDGVTLSGSNLTVDFVTALPADGTYGAGELRPGHSIVVYFNVGIN